MEQLNQRGSIKSVPFSFSYSHVGDFLQAVKRVPLQPLQRHVHRYISERNAQSLYQILSTQGVVISKL